MERHLEERLAESEHPLNSITITLVITAIKRVHRGYHSSEIGAGLRLSQKERWGGACAPSRFPYAQVSFLELGLHLTYLTGEIQRSLPNRAHACYSLHRRLSCAAEGMTCSVMRGIQRIMKIQGPLFTVIRHIQDKESGALNQELGPLSL